MAIVKATYTKSRAGAKASIRYIEHRPSKDGEKITRPLFNSDGLMGRWQAYQMIDDSQKGSIFFRFVISPDPQQEDTHNDLHLRDITEKTMQMLEERLHQKVSWVSAVHDDHAPHRHVHLVAVVSSRLNIKDFQELRVTATQACSEQRKERDLVLEQKTQEQGREEEPWERQR